MIDRWIVVAGLMLAIAVALAAHGRDTVVLEEVPDGETRTIAPERFALTPDAPLVANETWNLEVYTDRSVVDFPTYLIVSPVRIPRTIGLEKVLANDVPGGAPPFSPTYRMTDRFAALRGLQDPVDDVEVRVVVVRPKDLPDEYVGAPVKRKGLTVRARSRRGVIASRRVETELEGEWVDPETTELREVDLPEDGQKRRDALAELAKFGARPAYREGGTVYFRMTPVVQARFDALGLASRVADLAEPVRVYETPAANLGTIMVPDEARRILLHGPDSPFWVVLANTAQQTALSNRGFRIMPRVPAEDRPRKITLRLRRDSDRDPWPTIYGVDLVSQYGHTEQGDIRVISGAAWDDVIARLRRRAVLDDAMEISAEDRP